MPRRSLRAPTRSGARSFAASTSINAIGGRIEESFRGTIDGARVHPRKIVRLPLQRNSAAVIIAHNHPSGVAEPSQARIHLPSTLGRLLALVDIRLLDHIIGGDGQCVSLAERGLLLSAALQERPADSPARGHARWNCLLHQRESVALLRPMPPRSAISGPSNCAMTG